jgi:hypothetical protein
MDSVSADVVTEGRRVRRRIVLGAVGLVCIALIAMAVPSVRHSLLRAAGWALVFEDRLPSSNEHPVADIIVISHEADGAGILEAADLVHRGVASRVAMFADPPDSVDQEFLRRGIPYIDATTISIQQLHALGVASVEQIPWAVEGTHDEANTLPGWVTSQGFRTILFISTTDHSRRTYRVLARTLPASGIRVIMRYSRYSPFDPNSWWLTRNGVRTEIVEAEKLLLDFLRHPFS